MTEIFEVFSDANMTESVRMTERCLFDHNNNKTSNISLNTLRSDSRHVITFSERRHFP